MLSGRERNLSSMLPRWWIAPDYEPIRRDKMGWRGSCAARV